MSSRARSVHVALLRGINVSGKNRLPMADLARMFEDAGCTDVDTKLETTSTVRNWKTVLRLIEMSDR